MPDFVHLRVHSHYSFGRGASPVRGLVERAARLGMTHLALTDRNGLYGAVKFYREARRRGLVPILGAEVDDPADQGRVATVLAADRDGFAALCRLVTRRHLEEPFDLVRAVAEVGPGCRVLAEREEVLTELAAGPARGVLWAEINPRSLGAGGQGGRRMRAVAARLGLPLVATGDVWFAGPEEHRRHILLRAIGTLRTVASLRAEETALPGQYLTGPGEVAALFREFPKAVLEAGRLAAECRLELDVGEWKYPVVPVPPCESPFSLLWKLAAAGLERRYFPVTSAAVGRLVREMEVIEAGGFAPYFLLVHDILHQAGEWGLRHVGRGSAANSIVSYCLGFTAVDPLAHHLYFERFMNPSRTSPPDIDLDFSWKERERILDYVYRRHGEDRVAMISTHVTFGPRAAVRETARALGLGPEEIGPVTRRIPHWGATSLRDLKKTVPECRHLPLDEEPWAGIVAEAEGIIGFPRYLSVHPGGIIVAPGPLDRWCPRERAPGGLVVTQYDMFGVEDIGLIKIDLLSQRSLGVLEDVLADCPIAAPVDDFPAVCADPATRSLIREGRTMGVFYVESPAMRSLLRKLGTDTFEGLTAASSVIRPGVAESGMMATYIERHRQPEKRAAVHPLLREILGETYGVMIYQEDVIKVAHQVAGLSLADADLLRRSMSGKLRSREAMAEVRDHFLAAAAGRGVAGPLALELWRQIESFAGYAFCKAHSASYAVLSFQLAWLKAHHPARFMAAVLSNGGGFYSPGAYLQESRRLGLSVRLPDVNLSEERYTAEGDGVRIGLMAVKWLTRTGLDSLLAARRAGGPFTSLEDLAARTILSRPELEALVRCGAGDSFGEGRPALLWRLAGVDTGGGRGPAEAPLCDMVRAILPPLRDYTLHERCAAELDILDFAASVHPLELYQGRLPAGVVTAADLPARLGRRVRLAGWPIAYKRVTTKKGEVMKFLSLEDLSGTFEVVLFPDAYRRYALVTVSPGPFLVEGRVQEEQGVPTLVADRVARLSPPEPEARGRHG